MYLYSGIVLPAMRIEGRSDEILRHVIGEWTINPPPDMRFDKLLSFNWTGASRDWPQSQNQLLVKTQRRCAAIKLTVLHFVM